MKRVVLTLALAGVSLLGTGCEHHNLARNGGRHGACPPAGSAACYPKPAHIPVLPHGYEQQTGPAGPPTATYAYPYYTIRGPRDFLLNNPPSIGN